MRRHALVSSAVAIFGLSLACGGGGGTSGGGRAEITSMNAVTIASDVLAGILLSADLSTIGETLPGDLFPSAAGAAAEEDGPLRALAVALRAARAVDVEPPPSLPGGGIAPSAAFDPITEGCEGGGTVTVSGNIAGSEPSPGDRINARFDNCVILDDNNAALPALNGGLAFTITSLTGNPQALFSIVLSLALDAFTSGTGDAAEQIDGNATTSFNSIAPPDLVSAAEGASLRFESGDPNALSNTLTLRGFEVMLTRSTNDANYEIEGDGQLSSSEFTGQVSYDITDMLTGDTGGETVEHPGNGTVLVTGDASNMQIDIVDETNVDLELDLDDDGDFEETIHTTWTDLGF